MKRPGFIIVLAVAGISLAVVMVFLVRGGMRYYALQKVLKSPEALRRVSVMPTERMVESALPSSLVKLGYATFGTGLSGSLVLEAQGIKGTLIYATNRECHIVFLAPFSKGKPRRSTMEDYIRSPHTAAHLDRMAADPIDGQMIVEQSALLPVSTIAMMSGDEFMDYALRIGFKASQRAGRNEVYFFTNTYTKGVVMIGNAFDDRKHASVLLSALHDDLHLGLHVSMTGMGSNDIAQVLDPITGSFRFTMSAPARPEEVRNCIAAAGIPSVSGNNQTKVK